MLQLTKRTEYGLIALVHMVDKGGEFVSAREISDTYTIPRRLLAEVLKDMTRTGLVESLRGANGGYALSQSPESITVGAVVTALEGAPTLASCESDVHKLLNGRGSSAAPSTKACEVEPVCPIRSPLQRIRERIWKQMEHTSLRSLVDPSPIAVKTPTLSVGQSQPRPSKEPGNAAGQTARS